MKKKLSYLLEFGITIEILKRVARLAKKYISGKANLRIIKWRDELIIKKLHPIVNQTINGVAELSVEPSDYIWIMWWQGEDEMPENIKTCFNSVKRNIKGNIVVITEENYLQYVELPSWISEKFSKGDITITHLSDILRANLLYKYGGLWIDATILVTEPFSISNKYTYWTYKENIPESLCVSKGRWCGGVTYMPKHHPFASYLQNCFNGYWKYHKQLIDYWLIDFFTESYFRRSKNFRQEWQDIEWRNNLFQSYCKLNEEYTEHSYADFLSMGTFHYVSWRKHFVKESPSGIPTIYSHILEEYK